MWLLENLCQAAGSRLVCIDTWVGAQQYNSSDLQVCLRPACLLPQKECGHASVLHGSNVDQRCYSC